MRRARRNIIALLLLPIPLLPGAAHTSEAVLRGMAVNQVRPDYPSSALQKRETGVAVTEITVDILGHISAVNVLQSPSPDIAASVDRALRQWQFQPLVIKGQPTVLMGKLYFYFVLNNGKGRVVTLDEAFREGLRLDSASPERSKLAFSDLHK